MAPTFQHGKGAVIYVDQFNMSPFVTAATISASVDTHDTTTFGNNDKAFIGGLKDVTMSVDGLFNFTTGAASTSIDAEFTQALAGSSRYVVTLGPAGDTVGNRALLMTGDIVKYDIDSPANGVVKVAADIHGSQGYRAGKWLKNLASVTTTGSGASVNSLTTAAGGSAGGGTAHLHVTAESAVTSAQVRVQHSTSGSTWVNLITFTATTGVMFQRSTVSGTIKEKLRATVSAISGGGSFSYAVAFARNGTIV